MCEIKYVVGDVTAPGSRNVDLIVQVVNGSYKMGSGVAKAIMDKWPIVREAYMDQPSLEMGTVHYVNVAKQTWVANVVGQPDVRSKELPVPIDYAALRRGLKEVTRWGLEAQKLKWCVSIHMPRIGCGLAGGDWGTVAMIIRDEIRDFPVTVYDLPGTWDDEKGSKME